MTINQEKTLFEKIIDGEIPCNKIYEDEHTFAFLDISPNVKGHTLVIPKKPYRNIYELPELEAGQLINSVKKVSIALKEILSADGINILMNNDESAGQIVFHAHIHVLPRFEGDKGYHGVKYEYEEGETEKICEKVLKNLS
jgi:histidine triad (HIT) family protein